MKEDDATYIGDELDLFADCVRWKRYFRSQLDKYISGAVLEVGAGLGGTTKVLHAGIADSWVCLEPDASLARQIADSLGPAGAGTVEVVVGTVGGLPDDQRFDTILYMDVLEHIEDDAEELRRAASHLNPGGHIIVLSPAFNWLFSDFDRAIGHHRRYTKGSLRRAFPQDLRERRMRYLDAVGMLASLANRVLLRQSYPQEKQLALWDRWMIPVSRLLDPLVLHAVGRSILAVYQSIDHSPLPTSHAP